MEGKKRKEEDAERISGSLMSKLMTPNLYTGQKVAFRTGKNPL